MRIEYFQLIDRITALDLSELTIRAEAIVPSTHTIFEGHFPGYPLMPGVLLVEAMAQTSGWLIIARANFERVAFLAALKEVKLRSFVKPGSTLDVSAKIIHEGSGYAVTSAEIKTAGKIACDAEITFRITAFPAGEFLNSMRELAKRIELPLETVPHG